MSAAIAAVYTVHTTFGRVLIFSDASIFRDDLGNNANFKQQWKNDGYGQGIVDLHLPTETLRLVFISFDHR